jgi:hypothetical protein
MGCSGVRPAQNPVHQVCTKRLGSGGRLDWTELETPAKLLECLGWLKDGCRQVDFPVTPEATASNPVHPATYSAETARLFALNDCFRTTVARWCHERHIPAAGWRLVLAMVIGACSAWLS